MPCIGGGFSTTHFAASEVSKKNQVSISAIEIAARPASIILGGTMPARTGTTRFEQQLRVTLWFLIGALTAGCAAGEVTQPTPVAAPNAFPNAAESNVGKAAATTYESIVVYPNKFGGPIKRITGQRVAEEAAKSLRELKKEIGPADLAQIRLALQRIAKVSKRGAVATELSIQVLDAFAASSAAEFHDRIARLPVTISESNEVDSLGRQGIRREYWVRGVKKISYFRTVDTPGDPGQHEEVVPTSQESTDEGESNGREAVPFSVPTFAFCEHTDPNVGYVSGECATQQEKDDYLSAIAALDSDAEGMQSDVSSDSAAYCLQNQQDIEFCAVQDNSSPISESLDALEASAFSLESGELPFLLGQPTDCEATDVNYVAAEGAGFSCIASLYSFAASVVGYVASRIWGSSLAAVAGTSGALLSLGWAGLILGFGAMAIAVADLLSCME